MATENATLFTSAVPPPLDGNLTNNCTALCAIEDPRWCDNFFVGLRWVEDEGTINRLQLDTVSLI